VLLPEPEDRTAVGRARVENATGSVDLAAAGAATRVKRSDRPQAVSIMSDVEVQRLFGDALAALPPSPRHFVLNFRFESGELTDDSRQLVPAILSAVVGRAAADIIVVGHTDTMGTPEANFTLGLKRAFAIRTLLVNAGIDASRIQVSSLGETDPLVHTADNIAEPRNRRVDIAVR
jgi:outer membrane protein OmpA-like peptidoglycan-associated protein